MIPDLKRIGFWTHKERNLAANWASWWGHKPEHPLDHVDHDWAKAQWSEKATVLSHLKSGQTREAYFGWHTCILCGAQAGTKDLTDGVYVWPEGYAHYVEEHDVKPPQDFIDHVMGRTNG